jgi:hypothetical protein
MSTVVSPPSVTAMTTRRIGMLEPPVSRNSVCSGERFEMRNVISKPLCVSPELDSTFTSCTASSTARGTGIGTPGPIISCRRTGSGTGHSLRQRDAQRAADRLGELAWIDDAVRVGEAPPELGVARRDARRARRGGRPRRREPRTAARASRPRGQKRRCRNGTGGRPPPGSHASTPTSA